MPEQLCAGLTPADSASCTMHIFGGVTSQARSVIPVTLRYLMGNFIAHPMLRFNLLNPPLISQDIACFVRFVLRMPCLRRCKLPTVAGNLQLPRGVDALDEVSFVAIISTARLCYYRMLFCGRKVAAMPI